MKNKLLIYSISISIIIISLSVAFYFLIELPKIEKEKINQEKAELECLKLKNKQIELQEIGDANNNKKNLEFEKKQECSKHKERVIDKLIESNTDTSWWKLEEMFYSPIVNSCVMFYTNTIAGGGGQTYYNIVDVLTNESYLDLYNSEENAINKVKYLKGN
jgi:hypothetical protein